MLHAFAQGLLSFSIFRSLLGIAEAGNWPGAAKANAEWFPTKERALAQGILTQVPQQVESLLILSLVCYRFTLIGKLFLLWSVFLDYYGYFLGCSS